jgi:hypothetical protein
MAKKTDGSTIILTDEAKYIWLVGLVQQKEKKTNRWTVNGQKKQKTDS